MYAFGDSASLTIASAASNAPCRINSPRARKRARCRRCGCRRSHLDELLLAAQPALEMRLGCSRLPAQKLVGSASRLLDQLHVALEIGETQQRNPRLPSAEEFARTANQQILPRDLEPIAVLVDHLEPRFGHFRHRLLE